MFAIIQTGGKQYRVTEGEKIKIEKIDTPAGEKVIFEDVFLVSDEKGENTKIGAPNVAGAKVEAKVIRTVKGDKIRVFKMKPKKRYRVNRGHRQFFTEIEVAKILA